MGFFKKSEPKELALDGIQIALSKGWSVVEGFSCYVHTASGGHQKNLRKLFAVNNGKNIPIRLEIDLSDKDVVDIYSAVGRLGEVSEYYKSPWWKRAYKALDDRKFHVGTANIYQNDDGKYNFNASLNRPYEISIDPSIIELKAMSEVQIEKTLNQLVELDDDADIETNSQVKSHAKKAVKLVAKLYAHGLSLNEIDVPYKSELLELCAGFISESESSADAEDQQIAPESFVQDWNDCISSTGSFAPKVPSEFELTQTKIITENPGIGTLMSGKSIVLSGDFNVFSRDEGENAIKIRGGKSPSSVSKKTFALVIGVHPGDAKIAYAKEFGIPIINEGQFLKLIETGDLS